MKNQDLQQYNLQETYLFRFTCNICTRIRIIKSLLSQSLRDLLEKDPHFIEEIAKLSFYKGGLPKHLFITLNGKSINYELNKQKSLLEMKTHYQQNFPFYKTRQNQLNLLSRSYGGGGGFDFAFNNLSSETTKKFSHNAPKFRIISQGLNLEGKCVNKNCGAFGAFNKCWAQKGFGVFHINEESVNSRCPLCKELIDDVLNLGIWKGIAKVEGVLKEGEKKTRVEKELRSIEDHEFLTFEDIDNTAGQWICLKITVVKLKK